MEKAPEDLELIKKYFGDFTESQLSRFEALKDLYQDWNSKINVISRKDIGGLYEKHILHSLSIAAVISFQPGTEIIDLGTGGGFPGIPLAIFFPDVHFLLADSMSKKLKVVGEIAGAIGLKNVSVMHTRVEDIKNKKFDFAVSRAVAPLKDLWKWSKPLIRKGNSQELASGLICLKGGDLTTEVFESGLRPGIIPLSQVFKEPFFAEKFLLHIGK